MTSAWARAWLPTGVTLAAAALLLLHGPVLQLAGYNDLADRGTRLGIPNAGDVLSNLPIALAGLAGLAVLWRGRRERGLARGFSGYALFFGAVAATAAGSAYYHLAPDNARLVWDRLPIALGSAGLLAALRAEARPAAVPWRDGLLLALAALASVAWWRATDVPEGAGDLRPYLLLQVLPLALVPLWQWVGRAPGRERAWFAGAIALYVAAKAAEFSDHELYAALGWISGHSLKHLLLALATAAIVIAVAGRRSA